MAMIHSFLVRLIAVTTALAGICIALMMVHITLDVVLRFFNGTGIPGTLTVVSYYYMVIAAFVPLGVAEYRRGHIEVELLTDMMPGWLSHLVEVLMLVLTLLVTGLLCWRSFVVAQSQHAAQASQVSGSSSIAVWPAYYALPVGTGLMALYLLLRLAGHLTRNPLAPPPTNTPGSE